MAHLKGVICFSTIFGLLVVINLFQTSTLLVWLFSRKLFWFLNRCCAAFWWGLVVFWFEKLYGMKVVFTGDNVPSGENVVLIANHQGITDVPAIMSFGLRKRRLGDLKWFVKDIIKYVPGPGWGMLFLGCIYVKRNWFADKGRIYKIFDRFRRSKIPFWIISFVEGTRITSEKLKRSQKFARAKGLSIPRHVMIPKAKGFAASVTALREEIDAVYDVTIGYPQGIPLAWQIVQGEVKEIHVHVDRVDITELPTEESELTHWLQKRFEMKDRLLAHLYVHKAFPN